MPAAPAAPRAAVVAGYDDSDTSRLALRWAAAHAATLGRPLRVVHAWVWPVFTKNLGPVTGVAGSGLRHSAEAVRDAGAALARAAAPGLPVEAVMAAGLPAQVLRDAAAGAALLVVGSRGMGGMLGHLAGSVCLELAGSAPCPLMVVRRFSIPGQPVAAAIDADAGRSTVLAEAARLATATGAALELIHISPDRTPPRPDQGSRHQGRHAPLHGPDLLADAITEARRLAPGLSVTGTLRQGRQVARELAAAAAAADVLVLGSHHRGAGLGNTVSAVLHQAPCNVLITR
ncbi:MAG TPA: universal stress protein [Arthrobacter sp.]|nr:universal stress protein [Arthrobacter sp.]